MGEPSGDLDFAQEPIGPQARSQVRAEHLESDRPAVFQILGQIDGGHAPAADLALEPIALGERVLEVGEQIAHTAIKGGRTATHVGTTPSYGPGGRGARRPCVIRLSRGQNVSWWRMYENPRPDSSRGFLLCTPRVSWP